MSSSHSARYPPLLSAQEIEYLVTNIQNWSLFNGLVVRPHRPQGVAESTHPTANSTTAPVTLFPSLFPKGCFLEAKAIQCAYNQLYASIAQDEPWLAAVIDELAVVDDFIAKLWQIHNTVKAEGYAQKLSLGIFRSDYMIHEATSETQSRHELRQVEFNTIASSFGGLSSRVSDLHKYLLDTKTYDLNHFENLGDFFLPENPSVRAIAEGLVAAHQAYGPSKSKPSLDRCILFVVQEPENNIFDQLALSLQLQNVHGIPVFRLPFAAALSSTSIASGDLARALLYHPPHAPNTSFEVTTLYFRAGYSPSDYVSTLEWDARLHLERSAAIKCPSILLHLAGSKKIQQILATPSSNHLQQFLRNSAHEPMGDRLRSTFAAIYPLDSTDDGRKAIAIAQDEHKSKKYVLKPQREGGGNNIYGIKIPTFLKGLGDDERKYAGHILMELIEPPSVRNTILRDGKIQSGEVIGELGIFGVCLWRTDEKVRKQTDVILNKEAGFLLRTKGRESEEGGVAAGFGAIDSPCLADM